MLSVFLSFAFYLNLLKNPKTKDCHNQPFLTIPANFENYQFQGEYKILPFYNQNKGNNCLFCRLLLAWLVLLRCRYTRRIVGIDNIVNLILEYRTLLYSTVIAFYHIGKNTQKQ